MADKTTVDTALGTGTWDDWRKILREKESAAKGSEDWDHWFSLGADADLVVFDPKARGTISAKTQQMNVDYSAFEGWPIQGRTDVATVRGRVQVRGGKFVGVQDHGRMLRREPTHSGE